MIANLRTWLPDPIIPIVGGTSLVLAILLDVALFMVLYLMLPHGASSWREILPGAIGAGLLWELAKKAFLFFVSTYISVSNLVYGSVAAIIAFLTWAYLSGLIFLFGAYLSVSYYRQRQQQQEATGQNSRRTMPHARRKWQVKPMTFGPKDGAYERNPDKKPRSTKIRRMKAKLIFNPSAGAARGSPIEILDVIHEMQAWKLVPEAFLVEPGCDLSVVVQNALAQGFRMFVVCGGDGTILAVAGALTGTAPPWGSSPPARRTTWPSAWGFQRISRLPSPSCARAGASKWTWPWPRAERSCGPSSWLVWQGWVRPFSHRPTISSTATWRGSAISWQRWPFPPAEMHLVLDNKQEIHNQGHMGLVSNMPYIGPHFQVSPAAAFNDGLLDVLLFTDLSKMDLLGYAAQKAVGGGTEDSRIQHFQARTVDMDTQPAMPVMADGLEMGEGPLHITVQRHALAVMVGTPEPKAAPKAASGPGDA